MTETETTTTWLNSPRVAEEAVAEWMRSHGYRGVRVAGDGTDGGIDVHSEQAVAQVKAHMSPQGRPVLQALVGAALGEQKDPLFFASAGYTAQAVEWANKIGLPLFTFTRTGEVEPANPAARQLAPLDRRSDHDNEIRRKTAEYAAVNGTGYYPRTAPHQPMVHPLHLAEPPLIQSDIHWRNDLLAINGVEEYALRDLTSYGAPLDHHGERFGTFTSHGPVALIPVGHDSSSSDAFMICADPRTDEVLWERNIGMTNTLSSIVISIGSSLLIASTAYCKRNKRSPEQVLEIACYSADRGRKRWQTQLPSTHFSPSHLFTNGKQVIVGYQNADASNREESGSPKLDFGVENWGGIVALDSETGEILWHHDDLYPIDIATTDGQVIATYIQPDPHQTGITAWNARFGSTRWSHELADSDNPYADMSIVSDGVSVWFLNAGGLYVQTSMTDGTIDWAHGGSPHGLWANRLISCDDHYIYALAYSLSGNSLEPEIPQHQQHHLIRISLDDPEHIVIDTSSQHFWATAVTPIGIALTRLIRHDDDPRSYEDWEDEPERLFARIVTY